VWHENNYSYLLAIFACLVYLFPAFFTFCLFVSLVVRCVSYRQQIVGSCFLIQSDNLCLLIRELSLIIFGVMIERYLPFSVFLLLFFPSRLIVVYFWHVCLQVLLFYWVNHACYFPSSHGSFTSPFEFLSWPLMFVIIFHPLCVTFPLSIFCNVGLMDLNHLGLSLSWKVRISLLKLKDSFVGCSILDWRLFSPQSLTYIALYSPDF
jgi:hypothetical protein